PDHGCQVGAYGPYLESLGWSFTSTKGQRIRLRADELPRGKLVVLIRRHLDAAIFPHLKPELEAENANQRVSAADRQRFRDYQTCCERWGFQALPSCPQGIAVWLASESVKGAAHMTKLCNSVSTVLRALNFSDVTEDVLIRAMIRQARTEAKTT